MFTVENNGLCLILKDNGRQLLTKQESLNCIPPFLSRWLHRRENFLSAKCNQHEHDKRCHDNSRGCKRGWRGGANAMCNTLDRQQIHRFRHLRKHKSLVRENKEKAQKNKTHKYKTLHAFNIRLFKTCCKRNVLDYDLYR